MGIKVGNPHIVLILAYLVFLDIIDEEVFFKALIACGNEEKDIKADKVEEREIYCILRRKNRFACDDVDNFGIYLSEVEILYQPQ